MNRRMVFYTVGNILKIEAALLLLPTIVSLIYADGSLTAFLITIGVALVAGFGLTVASRPSSHLIYAKEGFAIVALAWVVMSAVGALPFYISGQIPNYIDAFFETVSGFTTTGASILTNIEAMSQGPLFWRSFTHWVGGMGVLVFVMAIFNNLSDRSIHIMRAEMPGPIVGKIVPRVKSTAKILYLIYIALTALLVVLLLAGGMPLFESLIHAFGAAGTGGFGTKSNSIAGYSPYIQWVITVFMLLFAINFNLYYLLLLRRFKTVFKSGELWVYITIVAVATAVITADIFNLYGNFAEAFRTSAFQVSSIITTTGYSTADFNTWPALSKVILLLLMFIGGCAGSTAGGLKVSRVMIMVKSIGKEIRKLLHPRSVNTVKLEGKALDETTLNNVGAYFILYMVIFFAAFLVLSIDPAHSGISQFETNFTAVAACFNNVGPGFAGVGPTSNFSGYNELSTLILSFTMLLGRLEIFPLLLALSPSTWSKK